MKRKTPVNQYKPRADEERAVSLIRVGLQAMADGYVMLPKRRTRMSRDVGDAIMMVAKHFFWGEPSHIPLRELERKDDVRRQRRKLAR